MIPGGIPGAAQGGLDALGAGETARFFTVDRQGPDCGLDCLAARFRTHAYPPHTHDAYVVGTVVAGCETFRIGGARYFAGPGELCLIDPGVVHDGEPAGGGFAYRMTYPSEGLMAAVAGDVAEAPAGAPRFARPIVADAALARALAAAHRLAEAGGDPLETDARLLAVLARLIARHAEAAGPARRALERPPGREAGPVARAAAYLDAHYADSVDLATLAGVAGIPRTRLIRSMRRHTGMTPHAWLVDRRVRAAQAMLRAGAAPADTAAACGFCDQSHLNRAFKARIGVPPGAFRAGR